MNNAELVKYRDLLKDELFNSCIPFWTNHMVDEKNGGIFSSLDREGNVYSTDKSVWFQGRCLWCFSKLINLYGMNEEWKNIAKSCKDFMDKYCFDADGRMYFTVTDDGRPLRKRRYFFSETFYIIGSVEYAKATGDKKALEDARRVYDFVYGIYEKPETDPYKITPKGYASTRATKTFANVMILLNVTSVMRDCDPANTAKYDKIATELREEVFGQFYKTDMKCVLEAVGMNGEFIPESSDTRVVNPGHSIEGSWFLMNEAVHFNDKAILEKALNIYNWSLDLGWDKEYGGLRYFVDCLGKPIVPLEADMKLWWPHTEIMIASLKAYKLTGDEKYFDWFKKATDYSFEHFQDREFGEWFGYLHRDGTVSHEYKGSTFKGPFHILRGLMLCHTMLEEMTK